MYLFYIDESGEREYQSRNRYFTLCALGIPASEWKVINTQVLALKRTYFNDIRVEVKSNWLRHPKEREKRYLLPYSITDKELQEFVDKLYDILLSSKTVIIASVIDKKQMQEQYTQPQSPSSLAYRLVFERVELFLRRQGFEATGILIFDKITEAKAKRKGYENLLYQQHLRYLEKGTEFVKVDQIIEGLLFIPSHENNLLQLADLCAYNIYRQFSDYGTEWDRYQRFIHRYPYFEKIEPKLDQPTGSYVGYGLKKFP